MTTPTHTISLAIATIALALPAAPVRGQDESAPSLEQRLERLVERLEESREQMHIPGMAIAVVKDDEVILSRGFGLADVDRGIAATDETLFAAGSTTKAFTAALVGMLQDDGRMSYDDPVRAHLPDYRLSDAEANEKVVVRDLLCHRTGLATMSLLWYGTGTTSDEVLRTSYEAELLHPFRERFNYSNISYLAAGEAAARTAGVDWHALVADRIFAPLGMTSSNTSIEVTQRDPRMAAGYRWDRDKGRLAPMPMRAVGAVAPAGAINSNVRDMAQWVRFQLGAGVFDGQRLLSPERHAETWSEHVKVGENMAYGLGWFLREWRGRRVIEHAGGIDGFTAEVAMLPDEGLGFVLLMNLFAAPLQETSRNIVFDALLGSWSPDDVAAATAPDFEPFLGKYIGNFGPFREAEFKVLVQNERLAVDVPGQMIFELNPPDEEGRWPFAMTDQIQVRFNERGEKVESMTFFQAGYEFELPREGVEFEPEIDLEAARRYLGKYRIDDVDAQGPREVAVVIQHNRLAVDVPGQMTYELHPPDEDQRWPFRVKRSIWVSFGEDDAGAVSSLTMFQDGRTYELSRVAAPAGETLPSADELLARMRSALGDPAALRSLRAEGTVRFVHMGVRGRIETICATDSRRRERLDLGRFGSILTITSAAAGHVEIAALPWLEVSDEMLEHLRLEHPFVWLGDWRDAFEQVTIKGEEDFEGERVYVVVLKPKLGPVQSALVSVETGRLVARRLQPVSALGMRIPTVQRYGDYRQVGGVWMPSRVESANDMTGRVVIRYETVEPNADVSEVSFSTDPTGS